MLQRALPPKAPSLQVPAGILFHCGKCPLERRAARGPAIPQAPALRKDTPSIPLAIKTARGCGHQIQGRVQRENPSFDKHLLSNTANPCECCGLTTRNRCSMLSLGFDLTNPCHGCKLQQCAASGREPDFGQEPPSICVAAASV